MKRLLKNKVGTSVLILISGFLYGGYTLYDFWEGAAIQWRNELQTEQQSIEQLKAELQKVKSFADNIAAVKQGFREQSLQLESLLESIPRAFELNPLLKKLNVLAQSTGIEIVSFKPQKEEQDSGFFKALPIELSLRGPFVSTLVFFDQISKLKRVVSFEDIKMSSVQKSKDEPSVFIAETSVKMNAFRLSDG